MNSLRGPPWILASITYLALSGIVIAQRAAENAVTAAEDAFGTAIGLQNVSAISALRSPSYRTGTTCISIVPKESET